MKVQVLASVMHESPEELIHRMNLQSDAVVINQCDEEGYEELSVPGGRVEFYSMRERGVGRSRNAAIARATGDICLFSDSDIVYEEGYAEKIVAEFEANSQADMILFNVDVEEERRTYHITDRKRVRWYNCGRYGAVSFALRREALASSRVKFSLLFGGGAKYSNGEDSLFLKELMDKGYRVFTAPVTIGREEASESSWFDGYNEKFFVDRGVLYHFLYGVLATVLSLRFLLAHKNKMCSQVTWVQAYRWMRQGIKEGREIQTQGVTE